MKQLLSLIFLFCAMLAVWPQYLGSGNEIRSYERATTSEPDTLNSTYYEEVVIVEPDSAAYYYEDDSDFDNVNTAYIGVIDIDDTVDGDTLYIDRVGINTEEMDSAYWVDVYSDTVDSIDDAMLEEYRTEQVKSIFGVDFGSSREKALSILRNKFGKNEVADYDSDLIFYFNNVNYGGINYDNTHFYFQSDGVRTYFNKCILVKDAKNKSAADKILDNFYNLLNPKYNLYKVYSSNGFNCYAGGISPLWNDGSDSDNIENSGAIYIDVIEYDDDVVSYFGSKYGVRIMYGPYYYVKETF